MKVAAAIDPANVLSAPDPSDGLHVQIDFLRASGVNKFDPVRFHYIETLARRAAAHHGSTRRLLDAKLENAVAALRERFDLAQHKARETVAQSIQRRQDKAGDLQQLFTAGDFKGVHRLTAALKKEEQGATTLSMLLRELEQHALENKDAHNERHAAQYVELKTIRNFRDTWAKLSVDRQVAQALEQAPKNAGPINSHMLVLRLLSLMRDISPDYLNRFMIYADTLLSLDQDDEPKPAELKKGRAVRSRKK